MDTMARIRIDENAAEKLDEAVDKIEGTKSGIASEAIRDKVDELLNQ